jgi:hypothetical protein
VKNQKQSPTFQGEALFNENQKNKPPAFLKR